MSENSTYEIVIDQRARTEDVVLIATRNPDGSRFKKVLDSFQETMGIDIIIIDDGSHEFDVNLSKYQCILMRLPENVGVPRALNVGLDYARAENYRICFKGDDDDVTLPGRYQKTIAAFEEDESIILVAGLANDVDLDGRQVAKYGRSGTAGPNNYSLLVPTIPARHATFGIHLRRSPSSLRYDPYFKLTQDYDFIFSAAKLGKVVVVDAFFINYLRASTTRSFRHRRRQIVFRLEMFKKHLSVFDPKFFGSAGLACISLIMPEALRPVLGRMLRRVLYRE